MRDLEGDADCDEATEGVADQEDGRRDGGGSGGERKAFGLALLVVGLAVCGCWCWSGGGSRGGGVLDHIHDTCDERFKVRVVGVDATFAMAGQVEHHHFFAGLSEAVQEGEPVVSCMERVCG